MDNAIYSYYEELGLEGSGSEWSAGGAPEPRPGSPAGEEPHHRYHVVASFVSLATTFYAPHQKSSRAHSSAPPLRIKPAYGWALIRFLCPQNWLTLPAKQTAPPFGDAACLLRFAVRLNMACLAIPCHGLGDADGEGDAAALASVPGTSMARYCSTISSTDSSLRIMDISMRRLAA